MIRLPEDALATKLQPGESLINDLKWDTNSSHLLIGCMNGKVYEVKRPKLNEVENSESFLVDNIPIKEWTIKMMEFQMKKN